MRASYAMVRSSHEDRSTPGELLLHPLAIVALVVLVLNDHWWKEAFGNALTGKLSDFAGLALFPLVLVGGWEWACRAAGRFVRPARWTIIAASIATGAVFSAVKLSPAAAEMHRIVAGAMQWPLRCVAAIATGAELPERTRVALVLDASDLVALAALVFPLCIGLARIQRVHSMEQVFDRSRIRCVE